MVDLVPYNLAINYNLQTYDYNTFRVLEKVYIHVL